MDQSLAAVMRNINDALRLDDDSHDKEAYMKYLDCVLCITCNLQQSVRNAGGDVIISKEITKQVKLAQQCIDRVAVLVEKIGLSQQPVIMKSPQEMPVAVKSKPFAAVPPLPLESTANAYSRAKGKTPMELAYKQNHQLMAAYRARLKRMNKGGQGAFNLSLSIQRKMAENLAIAKRTEMALAKKMQERQERLEEQAAKRFTTPIGMSEEEQEQRQIYKKILEYEQDAKWLQNWREKLNSNPQEPEIICQLIQEILRCQDHPLTVLLKQYQYQIYEKIYPLVCNKEQKLEAVAVPLNQSLWPPELFDQKVPKECQLTLHMEVKDNTEAKKSHEENESVPSDQVSISQFFSEHMEETASTDKCSESTDSPDVFRTEDRRVEDNGNASCSTESSDQNFVKHSDLEKDSGKCLPDAKSDKSNNNTSSSIPFGSDDQDSDEYNEEKTSVAKIVEMVLENSTGNNFDLVAREVTENNSEAQSAMNNQAHETCSEKVSEGPGVSPEDDTENSTIRFAEDTKADLLKAIDEGEHLQTQLRIEQERAARILRQITPDYERYNAENMDDLFDDDEEADINDPAAESESNNSDQPTVLVSPQISETGPDSLVSNTSSRSSLQDFPSLPSLDEHQAEIERLSMEAYHRHLKNISADVHMYLDKLLILFTIAYEQLGSPQGRDQCYASLEEAFFKRLWKYLLKLFRLANHKEEIVLACKMTQRVDTSPRDLGVTEKLCLLPLSQTDKLAGKNAAQPYQKAITQLMCIKEHYTMLSKLECIVKVVQLIFSSIKDFYINEGYKATDVPSVGADDLLPVMSYVVMQSRLPQLVSECQAMSEFIHEGYIMGQEGYCLTTLETAVSFVVSSDLSKPISPI